MFCEKTKLQRMRLKRNLPLTAGYMNKDLIKKLAQEVGFDVCGITAPTTLHDAEKKLADWVRAGKHGEMRYLENYEERAREFWKRFPNAKSIIVLGLNYFSKGDSCHPERSEGSVNTDSSGSALRMTKGRIARYAWGKDYHYVIRKKVEALKLKIQENSEHPISFECSVDTKPLLERPLAERAGLGFIGKQTQLLSLQFGPWLFLSELITDLELEPDQPFQGSCGTCTLCIEVCPTDAIESARVLDARKCIAYLTIEYKGSIPVDLRSKIGSWVFGCDECLTVCPYTAKEKESNCEELKAPAGFGESLDLLKLFEIKSQGEYERKFEGTAILRAKRKQLLRNACIVLGNSKDKNAIPVLERAMSDSSDLVREHAEWALYKLQTPEKVSNENASGSSG